MDTETVNIDFQKLWLILKRRWLPAAGVFGCILGIAVVIACLQKPSYKAEGKLLIEKIDHTVDVTGLGEEIGKIENLANQSNPLKTEIEVINSIPILQKTIETLNLKDEEGSILKPKDMKEQLKLKNIPLTDTVQIFYDSTDPQEAAAVINKIMNLYIENSINTNRAAAVAADEFIGKQLPHSRAIARKTELALRQFEEKNHILDLNQEATSAVAVTKELEKEITETQAALADANTRSAMLQKQVGTNSQNSIAVNSLNQSAGVQKILDELQQVESQLAVEETRFVAGHPSVQALQNKRTALKSLLQERVAQSLGTQKQVSNGNLQIGESKQKLAEDFVKSEVDRLGLVSRLASLSNAESVNKQRFNILPKLKQRQRELERELEVAQSTYKTLLQKQQEVRVAANQSMGNARVIESALVPEKSSLKKPAIILVLGLMLSTLCSGATIITLEVRDKYIKTLKETKEVFDYIFLGAIPYLRSKATSRAKETEIPELPVKDAPRSSISEAYRMLQANLKFLSSDKQLQVITVTSSVPGEGKSTVSANLAVAKAELGHRVLLVDGDMRRPMQHHIWGLTNAEGLSDAIVGQVELDAAVKKVMPNLDVLTAGVIPPSPLALLDSKRMASLIANFSQTYDFVIFDAPPLVVAADALTLGKMTDGILLVARPGVVDEGSAATAKDSLERSEQKVLGLVVNGVIPENESDSYFYFSKEYYVEEDSTSLKLPVQKRKAV